MLEREIAEFGRRMGIPSLALGPDGLLALDVDRMGRLHLERRERQQNGPELLLYLAAPCPPHDRNAAARVLDLCHYRHAHPLPLAGGVHKEQFVLLTRMDEQTATAAAMENAVKFLAAMMEKAANG